MFNLTRSRHFPSKDSGEDIYCHSNYGPCFWGSEYSVELSAHDEPLNGKSNCSSWANCSGYLIQLEDEKNQLTNQADGEFKISELEVWLVEHK